LTVGAGLAIAGGVSAAGGITSAVIGSNAAKTAAQEQEAGESNAINEENQIIGLQEQNQAPYLSLGQTGISNLMAALQNGTYGPGSNPNFTAPTLQDLQNYPGFQFSVQQGEKNIGEAQAASGGAFTGGTIKAEDQYATNLGTTTYGNEFNQALSTYEANLGKQAQEFQQLITPVQIGEGSAASLNSSIGGTGANISQLLASLGATQAAGTVGSANAISSGISGATSNISSLLLLGQLLNGQGGGTGVTTGQPASTTTSSLSDPTPYDNYLAAAGIGPD
jgi:hypothetical protein